jgi:hypothetical protein
MGCWLGCSSRRAAGFGLFLVYQIGYVDGLFVR